MKLLVLIVGLQLESILNVSNANQKTVAGLTVQRGIAPTVVMTNTQETKARNNKGAKMSDVEKLHEKISSMSLGDLCLLCGNAINIGMEKSKVEMLLQYLEIALTKELYLKRLGLDR